MGEEWMVVSAFPTQQQGADLGSCLSPVGATVMVKSLILYVNREFVAEGGDTLSQNFTLHCTWCEIVL